MNYDFSTDGFMPIEITQELEAKIKYALMLAERADNLKINPTYTHTIGGYPGAIREGIAVMKGEVIHRAHTSLGSERMLDHQIEHLEKIMIAAAKEM
jgi:hypothetical protein